MLAALRAGIQVISSAALTVSRAIRNTIPHGIVKLALAEAKSSLPNR
jgi:hypothetical protein